MRYTIADITKAVIIGRRGEKEVTTVKFDVSEFLGSFGTTGVFTLIHQRATDTVPYPVVTILQDNYLLWTVSQADVQVEGIGKCELIYTVNNKIAKSVVYSTLTLTALGESGEVPEPAQEWVNEVIDSKLDAEAWAVGKRNGIDVEPTDETYHNNAKYYAENMPALLINIKSHIPDTCRYTPDELVTLQNQGKILTWGEEIITNSTTYGGDFYFVLIKTDTSGKFPTYAVRYKVAPEKTVTQGSAQYFLNTGATTVNGKYFSNGNVTLAPEDLAYTNASLANVTNVKGALDKLAEGCGVGVIELTTATSFEVGETVQLNYSMLEINELFKTNSLKMAGQTVSTVEQYSIYVIKDDKVYFFTAVDSSSTSALCYTVFTLENTNGSQDKVNSHNNNASAHSALFAYNNEALPGVTNIKEAIDAIVSRL